MSREYPCVYFKNGTCTEDSEPGYVSPCVMGPCSKETPSNADRIRAMTDEELAEWINNGISSDPCDYCKHNNLHCDGSPCKGKAHTETITEWLQQPAEEE